jgi:glyoxylase-like metal-dependent hydrolase (beta-lactamase superfamily II)
VCALDLGSRQKPLRLTSEQQQRRVNHPAVVANAIHAPFHSPGSLVYRVESEGLSVLFGQEGRPRPLDRRLRSNRSDYRRSLEKMASSQHPLRIRPLRRDPRQGRRATFHSLVSVVS